MINPKFSIIIMTLMTSSAVDNIRNLPSIAVFGKQILFFYALASIFFFIPCGLVAAQLSSVDAKENGIYHWVKRAFGPQLGLAAVWLQWTENLVWYPTVLAFIVGTLSHSFFPEVESSPTNLILLSALCFYLVSFVNLYGLKLSTIFITLCSVLGLLLPMTIIIILGINWYLGDNPLSISLTSKPFIPNVLQFSTWSSLTSVVLSLCGIEITSSIISKIKGFHQGYVKSLFFSSIIILLTLNLASLSIAAVVPSHELSFVSGIAQSFETFFKPLNGLPYVKYIVIMAVIGSLGTLNNWLVTPIQGLLEAAKDGKLPPIFAHTNKHNVPTILLITQATCVTLLLLVFNYFPTINSAYWVMTVIASQLYMIMYILMFISFLKMRNANIFTFKIPGGNKLRILIGALGIIGCTLTIIVGFIPFGWDCDPIVYAVSILSILIAIFLIPHLYVLQNVSQNYLSHLFVPYRLSIKRRTT